MDAKRFVTNALLLNSDNIDISNFIGAGLYEAFLASIFNTFSTNVLYGVAFSNIAFMLSVLLIFKILHMLQISLKVQLISLYIILLYPSLLMYSVSTLREPYQYLLLTLVVYLYLYLVKRQFKVSLLIYMTMSVILFGLTHNGLLPLIPFILIILMIGLFKYCKITNIKMFVIVYGIFIVILMLILMISGVLNSNTLNAFLEGDGLEYAETYRERIPDARSSYSAAIDLSNPLIAIVTLSNAVMKYFIMPLPWNISNLKDIVIIAENLVRIIMLFFVIYKFRALKLLTVLLGIYTLLEIVWAMGTANWGTASRHHIVQAQLLIILFAVTYDNHIKNKINIKK